MLIRSPHELMSAEIFRILPYLAFYPVNGLDNKSTLNVGWIYPSILNYDRFGVCQ